MSSMLTVSCDGITSPAFRRGASFVPVVIEMAGLLNLALVFWSASRPLIRVLAGYCALMCFAGVALTGSRGGYLSVVFGLGVFAVLALESEPVDPRL